MNSAGAPILLRTDDEGLSWRDLSSSLPSDFSYGRILSLGFSDIAHGWVIAADSRGLRPFIASTADEGASWSPFGAGELQLGGAYVIGRRAGRTVLLHGDGALGSSVRDLAQFGASPERIQDPQSLRFRAEAYAEAGDVVFVAGYGSASKDGPFDRPAIYAVGKDQAVKRTLPEVGNARVTTLDFEDASGLAGGAKFDKLRTTSVVEPLCMFTRDRGQLWRECELSDFVDSFVSTVLSGENGSGWLAVNGLGVPSGAILHTTDGGAAWEPSVMPRGPSCHIAGLAAFVSPGGR